MSRITKTDLKGMLKRLNDSTYGTYKLSHDIQGWQLRRIVDITSGAESDIGAVMTTSETYYMLYGMCRLLEAEKWLVENMPHRGLMK